MTPTVSPIKIPQMQSFVMSFSNVPSMHPHSMEDIARIADRILVMYEGEIVGEFDPKKVTVEELGLYMAGAKRQTEGGNPA